MSMEEKEPETLFDKAVCFIDTIIPQRNPHDFSKKVKQFLRNQNATKEQKKELKSKLASFAQSTFYTIKTLSDIKNLDCVASAQKSIVAWVDTLDTAFNVNVTTKPQETVRMNGHKHAISCLSISPDQKCLITGSKGEDSLKIWQLEPQIKSLVTCNYFKYAQKKIPSMESTDSLSCVQFSPNEDHIVCADSSGRVCVIKVSKESNYEIKLLSFKKFIKSTNNPFTKISFISGNRMIISNARTITFWKTTTWKINQTVNLDESLEMIATFPDKLRICAKYLDAKNKNSSIQIIETKGTKRITEDTIHKIVYESALFAKENVSTGFDSSGNLILIKKGTHPKFYRLDTDEPNKFLLPDWTSLYYFTNPQTMPQSLLSASLIDQRKPFRITTIYVPEMLSFKKLYLHMAIRKAIEEHDTDTLRKLRKSNLIETYGTPELLRGYIDKAMQNLSAEL